MPVHAFWETPSGREVRKWFEAFATVRRERIETGDPTAVPAMSGSAGTGRSGFCLSDVVLRALEVESFLAMAATDRQRRLFDTVFVAGQDYATGEVCYVFEDGTISDPVREGEEPPQKEFVKVLSVPRPVLRYDLRRFEAPEVDEVCKLWSEDRCEFLERELARLGRSFARMKGL